MNNERARSGEQGGTIQMVMHTGIWWLGGLVVAVVAIAAIVLVISRR